MELKYLPEEITLKVDLKKCVGCGMCATVCPRAVFRMKGNKTSVKDRDACIECGACMMNCASGTIRVKAGTGCAGAYIQSLVKFIPAGKSSCGCG